MSLKEDLTNAHECHRRAGIALKEARAVAREVLQPGESLLEAALKVEDTIREYGGEPAFPLNLSRNDEAAHVTPANGDTLVIGDDMIKVDIGVHIDGYIADNAFTVDFTDHPELIKASETALARAIKVIKDGVLTGEIGEVIESTIVEFGYRPIRNLTGHGLERWIQHSPPTIPNRKFGRGKKLSSGDVIAIEPFATDGEGLVADRGKGEIFSLSARKPVRLPAERKFMALIEKYKTLPFARRWIDMDKCDFILAQLTRKGIIREYPVLKEVKGGLVSQAEHSVIITKKGCEVIT